MTYGSPLSGGDNLFRVKADSLDSSPIALEGSDGRRVLLHVSAVDGLLTALHMCHDGGAPATTCDNPTASDETDLWSETEEASLVFPPWQPSEVGPTSSQAGGLSSPRSAGLRDFICCHIGSLLTANDKAPHAELQKRGPLQPGTFSPGPSISHDGKLLAAGEDGQKWATTGEAMSRHPPELPLLPPVMVRGRGVLSTLLVERLAELLPRGPPWPSQVSLSSRPGLVLRFSCISLGRAGQQW